MKGKAFICESEVKNLVPELKMHLRTHFSVGKKDPRLDEILSVFVRNMKMDRYHEIYDEIKQECQPWSDTNLRLQEVRGKRGR